MRLEGLEALRLIGASLSPARTGDAYVLAGRSDVLNESLNQLKSVPAQDSKPLGASEVPCPSIRLIFKEKETDTVPTL